MIGADSHKRTHTLVALDDVGRRLGEITVDATSSGHLDLLRWTSRWDEVCLALEDCRHLTRRLERDLLGAGQRVVRVPTRLMAGARRAGRQPGKSDPIDAEAVALAALRHDGLPVAELDGPTREVKLLVDHRHDLVAERTRIQSRLRWHLHELDPTLTVPQPRTAPLLRPGRPRCPAHRVRGNRCPVGPRAGQALPRTHRRDQCSGARAAGPAPPAGPYTAGAARLRGPGRGGDPGRDRRHAPVPLPRCLRPVHRHRPDPAALTT